KFGREPFRRSRSISTVRSSKPSRSRRCVAGEDGCLEPQIDQAMSVCGTCLYSGCCPRAAKRPGCSSAAEPRDECATVHSITSSVVARGDGGATMLSAFTFSTRATLGGARLFVRGVTMGSRRIYANYQAEIEKKEAAIRLTREQGFDLFVEPVGRAEEQVALQRHALKLFAVRGED